jgi:hypothetical protein
MSEGVELSTLEVDVAALPPEVEHKLRCCSDLDDVLQVTATPEPLLARSA